MRCVRGLGSREGSSEKGSREGARAMPAAAVDAARATRWRSEAAVAALVTRYKRTTGRADSTPLRRGASDAPNPIRAVVRYRLPPFSRAEWCECIVFLPSAFW